MNMQNCKTTDKSAWWGGDVWSITWFIDLLSMRCGTRWLLPFRRDSNPSHVVVGGWWWDCSYKGAHVAIKTISLEPVLRLIRRSCVPLYREDEVAARAEVEGPEERFCEIFATLRRVFPERRGVRVRAKFRGEPISRSYMRYIRKTSKIIQLQFRTFLAVPGTRD